MMFATLQNSVSHASRKDFDLVQGAVRLLGFAAAPTFAVMAIVSGLHGNGMPDMTCSMSMPQDGSLLDGMVPMYVLMSVFHSIPWLRLAGGRLRRSSIGSP